MTIRHCTALLPSDKNYTDFLNLNCRRPWTPATGRFDGIIKAQQNVWEALLATVPESDTTTDYGSQTWLCKEVAQKLHLCENQNFIFCQKIIEYRFLNGKHYVQI